MHEIDEDSVCIHCGLDCAEWWHLERMKAPEDREPMPPCTKQFLGRGFQQMTTGDKA